LLIGIVLITIIACFFITNPLRKASSDLEGIAGGEPPYTLPGSQDLLVDSNGWSGTKQLFFSEDIINKSDDGSYNCGIEKTPNGTDDAS